MWCCMTCQETSPELCRPPPPALAWLLRELHLGVRRHQKLSSHAHWVPGDVNQLSCRILDLAPALRCVFSHACSVSKCSSCYLLLGAPDVRFATTGFQRHHSDTAVQTVGAVSKDVPCVCADGQNIGIPTDTLYIAGV